ncbi:MAG: hypothetical protein HGA67_03445 [Candidatus Yonathbacteria bacterium]|nr:hypothetical protein [Candidatus Yonathbacteria bacterium]
MIDLELKHKLDELETVTQENNEMLHEMHRAAVFHRVITIIKWVFIVIFAMAGYYVLQPFVESARKTYEALQDGVMEVQGVKNALPDLPAFLRTTGASKTQEGESQSTAEDVSKTQ